MRLLADLSAREVAGKRCLVRINLDIKKPSPESLRIKAVIPTLEFLIKKSAVPIIMSHRGRPERKDETLSLAPAMKVLSGAVGAQLEWIENLRFDPREEADDESFARELAKRGELYINDDFATSHRAHASIVSVPRFLPHCAGMALISEIEHLDRVKNDPALPMAVIIGGVKIEDKLAAIDGLKGPGVRFLLGSAYCMPRETLPSDADITMPMDYEGEDGKHFDIGPKTTKLYTDAIMNAKTVVWSGPVGMAENGAYAEGSKKIAHAIGKSDAFSVAGGGDTTDFLEREGLAGKLSFVSTGGSATLAYLAGKRLPGLAALDND